MEYVIVAVFGLAFGSFLNVVIYRMPRGESIVFPGSHCTGCRHVLSWYENIPILSYIALRGKCSRCKGMISIVYPIVEIVTAIMCLTIYQNFGLSVKAAIYFLLFSSLIVAAFIDFDRQEIPDIITLPGIVIGLVVALAYPELLAKGRWQAGLNSVFGILVGGGSLYLIGFLGEIVFKKEAMGGGDVKLLAMIGAFLGWKLTVLTFFIAPIFGSFAGIIMRLKEGKEMIPYGPYICIGAFIAVIWGESILRFLFLI